MVQIANQLGAEQVRVVLGRFHTQVTFEARRETDSIDPERMDRALQDPLKTGDSLTTDLTLALLANLGEEHLSTSWSVGERKLTLHGSSGCLEDGEEGVNSGTCRLYVRHRPSWRLWRHASRRADAASLLRHKAVYSPARVVINKEEMAAAPAFLLNDHLRGMSEATRLVGSRWRSTRVAASNLCFQLAQEREDSVTLLRPALSAYVVRQNHLNLWVSGIRASNTLVPDGESSVAWALQYRRRGENISMRKVRKRDLFQAVLALNRHGSGEGEHLRVKVVRHGVTLFDQSLLPTDDRLEDFAGCVLLFADSELPTELSGLKLGPTEALIRKVDRFRPLLEEAENYWKQARSLLYRERTR